MISISKLDKVFNKGKPNEVFALKNINLEIAEQEFVVIVGSNGSGKTTLLNSIAGSILPSKGKIEIDGINVTPLPDYSRSRWIARVFQNPLTGTAPDLSILDNFRLAALRTTGKHLRIGITESFKKQVRDEIATLEMGLEDKIGQPMGSLSGGQRQALTLLMSVMDEGKILLLDEPTAALDPRSAKLVMETAHRIIGQYQLTAIMITHNMKEAFQYGNRILQMAEGRVLRDLNASQKKELLQNNIYEWFA
jgi:putative ABC transport system ATP-binding protein